MANEKNEIYFTPEGSPVSPDRFDVRVRLRGLTRGQLSPEDIKKYFASLPDETALAEFRNYETLIRDESSDNSEGNGALSGPVAH